MVEGEELDTMLDALVRGKTPNEIFGKGGLVKEPTKRLVERALEAELDVPSGYAKHEENARNGRGRKRLITGSKELEIECRTIGWRRLSRCWCGSASADSGSSTTR